MQRTSPSPKPLPSVYGMDLCAPREGPAPHEGPDHPLGALRIRQKRAGSSVPMPKLRSGTSVRARELAVSWTFAFEACRRGRTSPRAGPS